MKQTVWTSRGWNRAKLLLLIALVVPFLAACTEEKAEAVKLAAQQLRDEVSLSLGKVRELYRLELATYIPDDDVFDTLRKQSASGAFSDRHLNELMSASRIDSERLLATDRTIADIYRQFEIFAAIFENAPAGHLFAAEGMRRALAHSANLTVRLARLGGNLNAHPTLGRDNVKRARLVDRIGTAYTIQDQQARDRVLRSLSSEIQALEREEQANRQSMFASLARATLTARTVTGLIRDYETMDATDVLATIKSTLSLATAISGGSASIASHAARIEAAEAQLREDPLIAPLLSVPLNR